MDDVNSASGGDEIKMDIYYEEVEGIMSMTLTYYLSEEIVQEKQLISAPEAFSDKDMLEWLWRRSVMDVGGRLAGVVSLSALGEDYGRRGISVILNREIPARRKAEIRELILYALVSSMAKDWLFITNRKDVAYFADCIQSAVATVRWIVFRSEDKVLIRRPCSPF